MPDPGQPDQTMTGPWARHWLWLSGLVIVLDQLSKWWAEQALSYQQPVPVMPMFNLTLAYNTGAAFSFLSDAGGWQRWFFVGLAIVISLIVLRWLWRLPAVMRLQAAGLAMILGGALGNVIDRIHLGYVIDFIDVYYQSHHWPVFNLADSAITVGVGLLILDMLLNPQQDAEQTQEDKHE